MAEPADFVHIYDARADYSKAQEIDLFGEIAGISFSPDTEAFFVAIADRTYGSLLEFGRRHHYQYMDCFLWSREGLIGSLPSYRPMISIYQAKMKGR